jgi:hypothetical protein
MSMSALLQAVRNTIRSEMDIENGMCRIMPGPKPPPSCGQQFHSVFGSEWTAGDFDLNLGIDESFGISIATTFRAGFAPYDDHGEELYIKTLQSIESRTRTLITLIDKSIEIMVQANNLIEAGDYKIIEPLRFQSVDPTPTYVDASWFGAATTDDPFSGLVQQVNFTGARRKQVTGSAT